MSTINAYDWISARAYSTDSLKRAINDAVKQGILHPDDAYTYYNEMRREFEGRSRYYLAY